MVIAGGTGFVGGEVVRLFERLGYETFVISRTPRVNTAKTPALFSEGSKSELKNVRTWDDIEVKLFVMVDEWINTYYKLHVSTQAHGLPSSTVAVINCCGQNVLDPLHRWNDAFKQKVYNSRVKTNEMLARAISHAEEPPAAFIHMSGVGFYPPDSADRPGGATEESPGGEHDWLAELVKDWEAAAHLPASVSTRVVSLR